MNTSGQVKIINGKKIAERLENELQTNLVRLENKPGLAIILVGDDFGSRIYVGLKEKAAKKVGIDIKKYLLPQDTPEENILKIIRDLNKDNNIHGILVQFPLPETLDENRIIQEIDPIKDVDGFHPKNIESLLAGQDCITPGLAEGIIKLIDSTKEDLQNKKAAIVANSDIFSRPLEFLLKQKNLKVLITNPNDNDFRQALKGADIIIVAIGKPNFIKGNMIKGDSLIIDVGYNRVGNKAVGDVDFDSVKNIAGWITPVPGGVGPMTVAMLLNNVVKAYDQQKSLNI